QARMKRWFALDGGRRAEASAPVRGVLHRVRAPAPVPVRRGHDLAGTDPAGAHEMMAVGSAELNGVVEAFDVDMRARVDVSRTALTGILRRHAALLLGPPARLRSRSYWNADRRRENTPLSGAAISS